MQGKLAQASLCSNASNDTMQLVKGQSETPLARSRSTSVGSNSQGESDDGNVYDTIHSQAHAGQVPEYNYPTPFIVKNTFIDTPLFRPFSLDEFFHERRVHSCPVEVQPEPLSEMEMQTGAPMELRRAVTTSAAMLATVAADAAAAATVAAEAVCSWWMPTEWPALPNATATGEWPALTNAKATGTARGGLPSNSIVAQSPQVLRLADAIVEPELVSVDLPTIGSIGHQAGTCKPCAFFYKRGCENGFQCPFCHLCDASEKKRRQKDKMSQIREMRRGF